MTGFQIDDLIEEDVVNCPGESTQLLTGAGKLGFIFDFTEFLRQSSWN
ncbi:hypothetical protein [Paenibacillus motobuensis]|uniref:Uncharacterized protein n=1 Tax=Paenibacillus motobuensis TaxID=295324 RepID=A0ABN0YPR1_9BACL